MWRANNFAAEVLADGFESMIADSERPGTKAEALIRVTPYEC
jgi:hypothetical protein